MIGYSQNKRPRHGAAMLWYASKSLLHAGDVTKSCIDIRHEILKP